VGWWVLLGWVDRGRDWLEDSRVDADAVDVVVSAVSAGAGAGLKATASKVVTDAYAGLRKLIVDRYEQVGVALVEDAPESRARRAVVAQDLTKAGAGGDEELVAAARRVLEVVAEHDPGVGAVIGIDVVGLAAVNVRLSDITAEGPGAVGVHAQDVTASGDFQASRIRATDHGAGPPDPSAR
jgi:hypothetical protein